MNTSIKCNEMDYVRYIGIFLVILGHMHYTINNVVIKNFIYLFHMPLFFLISGMLVQKNLVNKTEVEKKLFNSVLGLFLIYIIYNLPYCTSKENIIKIFTFNWMPNIATWFFVTMAFVKIICFNMSKCKSIVLLITSIVLITCIHYTFPNSSNYLLKSVCMAIPFYSIGYLYSFCPFPHVYYKYIPRKRIYIVGFVLLLIICLLFLTKYIGRVDMYTGTYKYSIIAYIMIALTGCCIPFGIAKCLTMQHAFIYYTSRCTGFIVGTHMIVCNLLTKLHLNNTLLQGIKCSIIIILTYYPICKIVYIRFPFLIGKIKFIK